MKKNILIIATVILIFALAIFLIFLRSNNKISKSSSSKKGVTFTPKSFQGTDFTNFLAKAKEAGEIISWAGDWNELTNEKEGPSVLTELSYQYHYEPMIELQFFNQANGQLFRPLNEANSQSYQESAASFAEKYHPGYMGIGIEINRLYQKSPENFDRFVELFSQTYDAIKKVSPKTSVFTVFQLEEIKGFNGGLFGGTNNPSNSQWKLLEQFPKSDLIAFTSYPGLVFKKPTEIPIDYYSEIFTHTKKSIAFTEIGWQTQSLAGWENSENSQREFITTFFSLTQNLKKNFVIWSFLWDQNTPSPFNSMGLINQENMEKLGWQTWLNVK